MESSSTAVEAGAPRHSKIDDDNDDDDDDYIHIITLTCTVVLVKKSYPSPISVTLENSVTPIPFGVQKLEFPHL